MKERVDIDDYKGIIDDSLFDELKFLAGRLKNIRVCHLNATSMAEE